MTLFYINGKTFTDACRHNKRIMKEAKKKLALFGLDEATKYIEAEVERVYKTNRQRSNKLCEKSSEYFKNIYKQSGFKSPVWASIMGYSPNYFRDVMCGDARPSVIFEERFKKTERKLKRLLTIKK